MRQEQIIMIGPKDMVDASCTMLTLDQVPVCDNRFIDIVERKETQPDRVINARYDGVGGNEVRWRIDSATGAVKAFYVYKTLAQKRLDARDGYYCNWLEAYIK